MRGAAAPTKITCVREGGRDGHHSGARGGNEKFRVDRGGGAGSSDDDHAAWRPGCGDHPDRRRAQIYPAETPSFVDFLQTIPGGVESVRDERPMRDVEL